MSLWDRATGHLDNACFGSSIHFTKRSAGIGADIVEDNIRYAILDIRLDDICYGGRADCIAVCNLGMGKSCSLFFVQLKQYLAPLYNSFTSLFVMDRLLKCSSFIITEFNNVGFRSCHICHRRFFLV